MNNPTSVATIEVEIRGVLDENKFQQISLYLKENSSNIIIDNRKTVFFIMPGKTLKVSEYVNKHKAKIALKIGDIVKDKSQTEFELYFTSDQFENAVMIFKNLGFTDIQYTAQERTDYEYKNCTISLKWSEDWGYHFEIEKVVSDENIISDTRQYLLAIAGELGLTIMNEQEFGYRCEEIDKKHRLKLMSNDTSIPTS